MAKIKVAEASVPVLNWLVASIEYPEDSQVKTPSLYADMLAIGGNSYPFCEEWAQGGPIIDRERIGPMPHPDGSTWLASLKGGGFNTEASTPLIAAMRCYALSKLGTEVEVPEEVLKHGQ